VIQRWLERLSIQFNDKFVLLNSQKKEERHTQIAPLFNI